MTAHATGRHIGLLDMMVVGQGPEYVESMVVGALDFRKRRRRTGRGIRARTEHWTASVRGIPGFRDASKAPSGQTESSPVLGEFALEEESTQLARALVGVWAESETELRDAVQRRTWAPTAARHGATPHRRPFRGPSGQLEEAVDAHC